MKWTCSLSALAFAGLVTAIAACAAQNIDADYAAMSTSDLEDSCAAAMAQAREAGPSRDSTITPGEEDDAEMDDDGAMEACVVLQERREAEGN